MIIKDELDFCESMSISIDKLLNDNFDVAGYLSRKEKFKSKKRIKHKEIKNFPNIVIIPNSFALHHRDLLSKGKILLVIDDFGFYQSYLNPKILVDACKYQEYLSQLEALETVYESSEINLKKEQLVAKVKDCEENIRLIKAFNGSESLRHNSLVYEIAKDLQDDEEELKNHQNNLIRRKKSSIL